MSQHESTILNAPDENGDERVESIESSDSGNGFAVVEWRLWLVGLSEKEQFVLTGLIARRMTESELAALMHCSQPNISQIKTHALKVMREQIVNDDNQAYKKASSKRLNQ
ncbi:MAG: sigma factor-like helix-turn-helix DNA-binding protein [Bacilli bacterium]